MNESHSTHVVLVQEVIRFIAEYFRRPSGKLSQKTTLQKDLGVDGDDAVDFLNSFSERFGVSFSRFEFHRYFSNESGVDLIGLFVSRGFPTFVDIAIEDLVRAAEQREWTDEP